MTPEHYRAQFMMILNAARIVSLVDVPDLLERIERADAVGGLIDPTLYREKHGAMMEDKQVLEAALPLWRLARDLAARAQARTPADPLDPRRPAFGKLEDSENPESLV